MKITKEKKQYIRDYYRGLTLQELAKKTNLPEKTIRMYITELNKTKVKEKEVTEVLVIDSFKTLFKLLISNVSILLLLVVATSLAYVNSIKGEFVSDDLAAFVTNAVIRDKSLLFTVKDLNIQNFVYYLMLNTFGVNPIPHHIFSLVLHATIAILVFCTAYMLIGKKGSVIAAFLFALHPITTEAVMWVSGVTYLYNALAMFLILIVFIIYRRSNKKFYWLLSMIMFLLAIAIVRSPWTLTIPGIIIIVDQLLLLPRISLKELLKSLPLLVISVAYALIFFFPNILARVDYVEGLNKSAQYKLPMTYTVPYTITMALKLWFFPRDMTFYHEGEDLGQGFFVLARIVLVVLVILVFALYKNHKKIAASLLIMTASLLPSLSPVQIAWFIAERYMYIGTAFFAIALATLLLNIEKEIGKRNLSLFILIPILTAYSYKTFTRSYDWKTPKSLWLATVAKAPYSPKVHNNLGDAYATEGDYNKSVEHFKLAIREKPIYPEAYHNLARTYLLMGQLDEAEKYLLKSLEQEPNLYQAYSLLSLVEETRGNLLKAKEYAEKALAMEPSYGFGNAQYQRVLKHLSGNPPTQ